MAVVVLPEPEGPVRQTKGFLGCAERMDAQAELILSWNTSSQRRTNWVSFCMARMISAMSMTRIKSFLSGCGGRIPRQFSFILAIDHKEADGVHAER